MKEYPIIMGLGDPTASRGHALLDFIVEPFLPGFTEDFGRTHGNYWKTRAIVKSLTEAGFTVDITDWRNMHAPPADNYDLVIGQGRAFEQSCKKSSKKLPKIFLGWGLYAEATKSAVEKRAVDLKRRRGLTIPHTHDVDHGALFATDIIYLGNQHTRSTYAAVNDAPAYVVPNPIVNGVKSTVDEKNFGSARNKFMWMAAYGTLRRSLDVVLEVFAVNPGLELWICGDISHEKDFFAAYRNEILNTSNIHYQGWVDVATESYREVTRRCGYIVYPSVSDGMPGSVVNAMASGVVPIVTEAAGMDCGGLDIRIPEITHKTLSSILSTASSVTPETLETSARKVEEFTRNYYSQESFFREFRNAFSQIMSRHGK